MRKIIGTGGFFSKNPTVFAATGMNSAKVMPVDLAMHTGLSRQRSMEQLLGTSTLRTHREITRPSIYDSLRSRTNSTNIPDSPTSPMSPRSYINPYGTLKKKKRVVFADDKGLALTVVRIFDSDPPVFDDEEISSPVEIKTELSIQSIRKSRLRLGFPQPSDSPSFKDSLAKYLVHLESCSLICGSLFGKVRVCNIRPEKTVNVRITYDSWRTHQDIPCTQIQQKFAKLETELYVFNVTIPPSPRAQDRVEFCVSFRPGTGNLVLWDNNAGQNYRILVEDLNLEKVSPVDKKPLMPLNFQSTKSIAQRNHPTLYRSASLTSLAYSKNTTNNFWGQENFIPKNI